MKKNIIFIFAALTLLFPSCNDFLDVESESKFNEEYVYSSKQEIDRVLNSVYAAILTGNLYGERLLNQFALNSDVEFSTFNSMLRNTEGNDFRCFDAEAHSTNVADLWTAGYTGVERANLLIDGIRNSSLYDEEDDELMQMLGEGITLRAMIMHDLVIHFGDIPFPKIPSFKSGELVVPVEDRNIILSSLIDDLIEIAPKMKYAAGLPDGVERASREFCYALIARIALTRGGYSLRSDKTNPFSFGTMQREQDYATYYAIARDYADSVITSGTHSLSLPFVEVFVNECNYLVVNNDDPIFELPFVRGQSGIIGFRHGPVASRNSISGLTPHIWGECSGSIRLNAFYRYSFAPGDIRRDVSVGIWRYNDATANNALLANGTPVPFGSGNSSSDNSVDDFTHYTNKWSKLWATQGNAMGNASQGNDGINFPYMRYADVLLMYAEAVNELENGVSGANGAKAKEALRQVRNRAFAPADRPLHVDQYIESASGTKETFFQAIFNERKWEFGGENLRWKDLVRWNLYSKVAYETFLNYYQMGDFKNGNTGFDNTEFYEKLPTILYYQPVANPANINVYQNTSLPILNFIGLVPDEDGRYAVPNNPGTGWSLAVHFNWGMQDQVFPRPECCYSLRGYIRGGEQANFQLFNPDALPVVRYILPIPRQEIMMSKGLYTNYYGY
ncbi:MAG: RagB/SusD family nutrient uptake outer membrane protein [Tannerella sp.]|jgi:hypothetical protein|nr:RagB/SusD family nutrient uptake outer membrane protein [Tannerella sp.]